MHNKKNIFEIWKENREVLPFKVHLDSWSGEHYVIVEEIKIMKWPYGKAKGQYFFNGTPGKKGEIKNSGTYRWTLLN